MKEILFNRTIFLTDDCALSSIKLPKPRALIPLLSLENKGIRAQCE